MCMSDIICITNRKLCEGGFTKRIEEIAKERPKAIILREKDLSESEYEVLAKQIIEICRKYGVPCVIHSFAQTAVNLGANIVHFPLPVLRQMSKTDKARFKIIGTSCHSVSEAAEAEKLGCTYIIAGHIFATDCKRDVPPRGLEFLSAVCNAVKIPVYAVGGIDAENLPSVIKAGAKGGCVMSGLMTCRNVSEFMGEFKNE